MGFGFQAFRPSCGLLLGSMNTGSMSRGKCRLQGCDVEISEMLKPKTPNAESPSTPEPSGPGKYNLHRAKVKAETCTRSAPKSRPEAFSSCISSKPLRTCSPWGLLF